MERPFAWIAAIAAVIAALCVLLPWHTIEFKNPLLALSGGPDAARVTHSGLECGLHGVWLIGLGGLAALFSVFIGLGLGPRLPFSPCRLMIVVALLLFAGAILVSWDLFRDAVHCFNVGEGEIAKDERENGFYIAIITSILGALSAGCACLVRQGCAGAEAGE